MLKKERMDKNHDFIFKGGYEKQCKEKKVDPDPKQIERMKKAYDDNIAVLNPCKVMYNTVLKMVMKHEAIVNELVKSILCLIQFSTSGWIIKGGISPLILHSIL